MTTKTSLITTIRKHCLECCGDSYKEVEDCTAGPAAKAPCALWAFRLGKDPEEPTEGRRKAGKIILSQES